MKIFNKRVDYAIHSKEAEDVLKTVLIGQTMYNPHTNEVEIITDLYKEVMRMNVGTWYKPKWEPVEVLTKIQVLYMDKEGDEKYGEYNSGHLKCMIEKQIPKWIKLYDSIRMQITKLKLD